MSATLKVRVGVEWVNTFHTDSCSATNLDYRDDHAVGFLNRMVSHGHTQVFNQGNDNAWETHFRHPDFGGDSLNWVENVHFCFFADHGSNWNNRMFIFFSTAHEHCSSSSNQWHLGCKMLKWLVLDCCQAVISTDSDHVSAVWSTPMQGVHLVFGFIGNGHDGWWNNDLGEDFGDAAGNGEILANAWLDCGYSWWLDDNPIVIAAGVTEEDAVNRREHESINWRDYSITATNWLAYKYRE